MSEHPSADSWLADYQRWRQARHDELAGPDSWLGLIGLFWLEAGGNGLGSGDAAVVKLPDGPARQGEVLWLDERVYWRPDGGARVELQTDRDGTPSTVDLGEYAFFVIERDGRLAVRLRDRQWAARQPFAGLACYAADPAWRIAAVWQPLSPARYMEVPTVSGELKRVAVSHQAVFEVAGQSIALLPMAVGEQEVFFVFRDCGSGKATYGGGRFLKAPVAVDGKISLDFNFAYNPPCAFTPFATCPLPPPENWLPCAVPAGEKKPLGK